MHNRFDVTKNLDRTSRDVLSDRGEVPQPSTRVRVLAPDLVAAFGDTAEVVRVLEQAGKVELRFAGGRELTVPRPVAEITFGPPEGEFRYT